MTRTSKRAIRPGFDDLEGRQLLSNVLAPSSPTAAIAALHSNVSAAASPLLAQGYYYFQNKGTGYYLYSSNDQQVSEQSYNGGANEQWYLSYKDGYYYLQNKATSYYLYSNDQQVSEHSYNGGAYEQWSPHSTKP